MQRDEWIEDQITMFLGTESAPLQAVVRAMLDNAWSQGEIDAFKRITKDMGQPIEHITIKGVGDYDN